MKKKTLVNEVKQFQKIAGILKENEDQTIQVDGMMGLYVATVGNVKLYSSESTDTGSNFDYFVVTPNEDPKFISVEIDYDPEEKRASGKYVQQKTGIQDVNLCKAIAEDINNELSGF